MDVRSFVLGVLVAYTLPFLAILWIWRRPLSRGFTLAPPPLPHKFDSDPRQEQYPSNR